MGKQLLFQSLKKLINAFIGGLIIGLCGIGFLLFSDSVLAMLIIGLGFLLCLLYGYDNFMIKLPYVFEGNKAINIIDLVIAFIGNFIGSIIVALIAANTGLFEMFSLNSALIVNSFIENFNHFELILYGAFAGIVIYFGVNTYKKAELPIARFLVLLLCGALAFALGGAMISYSIVFVFANGVTGALFTKLLTILLGNILGGISIPLLIKLRRKL